MPRKKIVNVEDAAVCEEKAPAKKATADKKATAVKKAEAKSAAPVRRRVTFSVTGVEGAEIFLAGSFNGWAVDARKMNYDSKKGVYTCSVLLEPGRYEYKFIINGVWAQDASNPNYVPSGFGNYNSVIDVE